MVLKDCLPHPSCFQANSCFKTFPSPPTKENSPQGNNWIKISPFRRVNNILRFTHHGKKVSSFSILPEESGFKSPQHTG